MIEKINKLNNSVLICTTIVAVAIIFGVSNVFIRSGNFSYENGETVIKVQGANTRKKINDEAYSSRQLAEKIFQLELAIKENKAETNPEVVRAFEDLKPTANSQIENAEKLRETFEEAIVDEKETNNL